MITFCVWYNDLPDLAEVMLASGSKHMEKKCSFPFGREHLAEVH